ncbi:MAG: cysteine--tRNA ligase [Candidatus Saccharimonadales bacterium]
MKLYNTLTRQIDEILPLQTGKLGIYTCGPTVYDYAHIGHWFTYVRADTLVRALQADGYDTTWVMNITDVGHLVSDADDGEDKLEKGARREGKTAWDVASAYTKDFLDCMELLHIQEPNFIVKATDHIDEQIKLIEQLESKGYTYVIDDGVYYDTSKFEGYAAFAKLDLDEQQEGARVSVNQQKRNPSDFALWKFSPQDHTRDMEWPSPWGTGFPGWHIECSAMSMTYLGESFDIHTGGIDHVPVHHTNEIAQSEAATGKRMAQTWMHSNHVSVEGEKISKSLGNGIRLQTLVDQGIPVEAIRLHILESHYRSQSKFSLESLQASANRLKHWQQVAALIWQPADGIGASLAQPIADSAATIHQALTNDLNTPQVLTAVDAIFTQVETRLIATNDVPHFQDFLDYLKTVLGIDLLANGTISAGQQSIIDQRRVARTNNDWAASDALRDQLSAQGIGIKDVSSGTLWFRL